jgi:MSHA biogenesis protein MshO
MHARGQSLLELVIVLIILGILVAFVAPILSGAVDSYDRTSRNVEVLTKMRYTMERVARELRAMRRDPADTDDYDVASLGSATKLDFCRSDGTRVSIQKVGSEVRLNYTGGFATTSCTASASTTNTLTDSVDAFTLSYRRRTGAATTKKGQLEYVDVDLVMTGTGTSAYSSSMRVDLRNP